MAAERRDTALVSPSLPVLPSIFAEMDQSIVLNYHPSLLDLSKVCLCLCRISLDIQYPIVMIDFD
jgi:hypothetical protein